MKSYLNNGFLTIFLSQELSNLEEVKVTLIKLKIVKVSLRITLQLKKKALMMALYDWNNVTNHKLYLNQIMQ